MLKKNILCIGLSCVLVSGFISPVLANESEELITSADFNGFTAGTFTSQVSRSEWAAATSGNAHTVEFISESEGDMAIELSVGSSGTSGVSVYRRGLAVSKSYIVREKVKVSDTNRRIMFRAYDDNTSDPIYAIQLLNGNVVARNGSAENIVATYKVDTEYEIEMRVNTDGDASTKDMYDLYIDGEAVATDYTLPRNISGNVKQIELMEAPSWATGGTSIIDDFYLSYYTPVVRVLESIEANVKSGEMAVGQNDVIVVSGVMSDGSEAKIQNAEVTFKSDNPSVVSVDKNGNISALSDGDATVTVTVKMGNVTLTEDIELTVIYKSTVDVISDDFEDYQEGDFLAQNKYNYAVQNLSGHYPVVIEKDDKNNKYLRFVMEDLTGTNTEFLTGKNTVFQAKNLSLTEPFSVKAKMKVNSFENSARVYPFFVYDELGTRALTVLIRSGKLTAQNGSLTVDLKEGLAVDTWYDIELVIYHDGDAETEDFYDVYLDGELLKGGLKMQNKLSKVISVTYMENTNYAPFSVFLDDISLKSIRFPKVEECTFTYPLSDGNVSPYSESLTLKYNNNMVGGEDKIKVYCEENEIPVSVVYNEKKYFVNFKEELSENTTYRVVAEKGMTDSDGLATFADYEYEFTTGEFDFKCSASAEILPGKTANTTISVKNNTDKNQNAKLILVQYNSKGNMLSYETADVTLNKGDTDLSRDVSYEDNAKYLGIYLWDGVDVKSIICEGKILPKDDFSHKPEEYEEKIDVSVKDFDEIIKITGNLDNIKEKSASLVIYSPDNEVVNISETKTDINGNYIFEIPFFEELLLNKDYTAVVMGEKAKFICKGKEFAKSLLSEISKAEKNKLYDIIKENNDYFNIDLSAGGEYEKLSDRAKDELWQSISEASFEKPEDITEEILLNIKKQNALDDMFEELKAASSGKDVIGILEKYSEELQLNLEDEYGYLILEQEEKNDLGKLFVDKSFENSADVKAYFDEQVLLFLLNNKSWKKLEEVINHHKDMLDVEFSAAYNKLHDIDKADFLKDIDAMEFSSLKDFKIKFNNELSKIKTTSKPSSNGGGGGSGGGVNYTVQSVIEKQPEKETDSKEELKFSDVSKSHWAYEYINSMSSKKLISGYVDGTFKPDKDITRAEFMKIIVESLGFYDENATADFSDMDETVWYYKYAASAVKAGLVTGYADGRIGGMDKLTRQDMAVIIYRAAKDKLSGKEIEVVFDDSDEIAGYAKEAVLKLCVDGIMNGIGNNTFNPKGNATRAMVVKVIDILCEEG